MGETQRALLLTNEALYYIYYTFMNVHVLYKICASIQFKQTLAVPLNNLAVKSQ